MNEFQVFIKPVLGGYAGYLRLPSDGEAKPILAKGGRTQIFPTEIEALSTATEHLVRYVNGSLYRCGDVAADVISQAEALFTKKPEPNGRAETVKQKGKTRRITVEKKRKRRR